MKEDILSITAARLGGIPEASMEFPLTSCGQGELCGKRHKGEYTLCSLPAGTCQGVERAGMEFPIKW